MLDIANQPAPYFIVVAVLAAEELTNRVVEVQKFAARACSRHHVKICDDGHQFLMAMQEISERFSERHAASAEFWSRPAKRAR